MLYPLILFQLFVTLIPEEPIFQAWVHLDGKDYPCRLQADFTGHDRIVGRDVLNALDVLFRGLAREVIVNP